MPSINAITFSFYALEMSRGWEGARAEKQTPRLISGRGVYRVEARVQALRGTGTLSLGSRRSLKFRKVRAIW